MDWNWFWRESRISVDSAVSVVSAESTEPKTCCEYVLSAKVIKKHLEFIDTTLHLWLK